MPDFYAGWNVERANGSVLYNRSLTNFTCRDSAQYDMTRGVRNVFNAKLDGYDGSGSDAAYAFRHWALNHGNALRYTGMYIEKYDTGAHGEWMRDYSIPRVIDRLYRKYPTVTFTAVEMPTPMSGFGNNTIDRWGIRIEGDTSVIPAFYWAGYLQRISLYERARDSRTNWKDVNKLLERSGARDHQEAWETLRAGNESPGIYALAWTAGPVVLNDHRRNSPGKFERDAASIAVIIKNLNDSGDARRHWFSVEEI